MGKNEIEKPTDAQYIVDALKSGTVSFRDFTDEFVDFVETGGAIIDPAVLEGVPFGILNATYREGHTRMIKDQKFKGDYVALVLMIADEKALNESGVDWKNRGIKPLDIRILTDGGTGIRRQMTRYLHIRNYAVVTNVTDDEIKETGKLGESDFDIPFSHWHEYTKGEKYEANDKSLVYEVQFDRMVIANRGTRGSGYKNEHGENTTWYLA